MVITPAQLQDVVNQVNAAIAALEKRVVALESTPAPKPAAKKVANKA